MKSSITATVEIKKNNGRDSFDAEIIFSLANAALLKLVAKRALVLNGIRTNAAAESISACNYAFGAILYVAGGPAAMAVRKVRIYCSSGSLCPAITFEGTDMTITPKLTIETMQELASAEPPDLPMLDNEVACHSCGAVELAAFRDKESNCHFCGQEHTARRVETA
jgi:hypothetical protein